MALGGTGIWAGDLRYGPEEEISEAAAELEALGYSAVWIPDVGGDVFGALARLLDATTAMTVATGILNVWMHEAPETAAFHAGRSDADRSRLLLGLGVSHAPLIGDKWGRPVDVMTRYLDDLDAAGLATSARCLAALGPRMLALAARRSAGAHPYLVTPDHTALSRQRLGPDALLAPEQGVVLESDARRARDIARKGLGLYAGLPNSPNNWKRLGFDDDDVSNLSDRLVDRLIAWGDVDAIAARVHEHRAAGADHVCVQVLSDTGGPTTTGVMPRVAWRELAPALI
jgi:probable F420-dependent oxidoreductase